MRGERDAGTRRASGPAKTVTRRTPDSAACANGHAGRCPVHGTVTQGQTKGGGPKDECTCQKGIRRAAS